MVTFLHTSDWHLGRMLYGRSLLEDQEYFLDRVFFPAVEQVRPDAVLLAGIFLTARSRRWRLCGCLIPYWIGCTGWGSLWRRSPAITTARIALH